MIRITKYILLSSIFFLFSCAGKLGDYTTSSTGKTGEILVVANPDVWFGTLKDTVTNFFSEFQYGLPQPEPLFSIFAIPFENFNKVLRPHRNVFMLEIDKSLTEASVKVIKDKWATPQTIIQLQAPNRESMIVAFLKFKESILNYFNTSERLRFQRAYEKMENIQLMNQIKSKYKFSLTIPEGYFLATSKDDFFWLRRETPDMSFAVLYYSVNYTDTMQLNLKGIIETRNKFTKDYIPGPTEGSYQVVSNDVYPPQSTVLDFGGKYAVETRGLWKLEHDFMGGPFINIAFVDVKNNKVIYFDGFVYAPQNKKRDQLRQVEALIYTFKEI